MSTNKLAMDGGTPVRDIQKRPWPAWPVTDEGEWAQRIEPALREVYLSRTEGLPGPKAAAFGEQFARYCGSRFARLLVHGTDAIAAALSAALDLDACQQAGEILIPNYTFIASASAPIDRRFTVGFVDVDPASYTMDPDALAAAIGPRTTAVLPVHILGHPADMERINAVARKAGLAVIEDAAQSHGSRVRLGGPSPVEKNVGALGDAAAFSFQSSKNLTAGEGGVVTTDRPEIDERVAGFMNVGRHPTGARWEYPRLGWNYRPSEYVAAILSVRLEHLESQIQQRAAAAEKLSARLGEIPGVQPPRTGPWCTRHSYNSYGMLLDPAGFGGKTRDEVLPALRSEGLVCWAGYTMPLSDQEGLVHLGGKYPGLIRVEDCPTTRMLCDRALWLPLQMLHGSEGDLDDVVEIFAKVQRAFGGK